MLFHVVSCCVVIPSDWLLPPGFVCVFLGNLGLFFGNVTVFCGCLFGVVSYYVCFICFRCVFCFKICSVKGKVAFAAAMYIYICVIVGAVLS